eukprot:7231891-Prymnesium_polylepis.2
MADSPSADQLPLCARVSVGGDRTHFLSAGALPHPAARVRLEGTRSHAVTASTHAAPVCAAAAPVRSSLPLPREGGGVSTRIRSACAQQALLAPPTLPHHLPSHPASPHTLFGSSPSPCLTACPISLTPHALFRSPARI